VVALVNKLSKIILPFVTILVLGLFLSTEEFDDFVGRLPDPGCLTHSGDHSGDDPIIFDIWYGKEQSFGDLGRPQTWINILGTVYSKQLIASLTYSINGGEDLLLSLGPDGRRLACRGDFNIEIDHTQLFDGDNQIVITAIDQRGKKAMEQISIDNNKDFIWPLPYSIDWTSIANLEDAIQIVDGRWDIEKDGLRPETLSYDRIIAVGDVAWQEYEVTVPLIIHQFDATEFPSNGAGFGIILRWNGHNDDPIRCEQPHCGWNNAGASGFYSWDENGRPKGLSLSGYTDSELDQDLEIKFELEEWYYLKMRVESVPDENEMYYLKIWQAELPEPSQWNLRGQQETPGPSGGSVLLVAHHVDLTFGNISFTPIP